MRRYEEPGDAIPHEVNALVLSAAGECFGEPFELLFEDVRGHVTCDKVRLEAYYHDLTGLSDRELLVQHGIWLVHHSCVDPDEYPEIHHYLATASYPDGTLVVICVDDADCEASHDGSGAEGGESDDADGANDDADGGDADDPEVVADRLRERYDGTVPVVTDRDRLVGFLAGFLAATNPCAPPGLEYILRWNNDVCDDLEIV